MFLEIRGIRKSFGEGDSLVEVLKGIDLSVEKGEFCVLFGPSGSDYGSLPGRNHKLKGMLSLLKFAKEVETDNPDAEKFSAYTLRTMDENYMLEDILFYGIEPDSRYVSLKLSDDDVVISSAYASKFGLSVGDSITLKEKYEDKTYIFTVTQIYPYEASLVVFLSRDHVNYSATGLPEHLKSGGIPPFFRVRP